MNKGQLYHDFVHVIGMITKGNDEELFRNEYLNNPVFAKQVKCTVALLMQCVDAYEAEEPLKQYTIRKQIESQIRLDEVLDLIKDKC